MSGGRRHHERRHSFDLSSINGDFDHRNYDIDFKSRRVRFNDDFKRRTRNKTRSRSAEKTVEGGYREMSVQEITSRLKESYGNIEKGLHALQKVYQDLSRSREALKYQKEHKTHHRVSISEIDLLLREVEALGDSLKKSGVRKRKYLEELSKLQSVLHEDRLKMQSIAASSYCGRNLSCGGSPKKTAHQRMMDESTKVTRDQEVLITKLKRDNEYLWKILQEIQQHLREEEISGNGSSQSSLDGEHHGEVPDDELYERNLPTLPKELPTIKCDLRITNGPTRFVRDERSGSENSNYSSNGSSISDRVKSLIKQTETIQQMIPYFGGSSSSQRRLDEYQTENINRQFVTGQQKTNSKRQNNFEENREAKKFLEYENREARKIDEYENREARKFDEYENQKSRKFNEYENREARKFDEYENREARKFDEYENQKSRKFNEYENREARKFDEYENQESRKFDEYENQESRKFDEYENREARKFDEYENRETRKFDEYENREARKFDGFENRKVRKFDEVGKSDSRKYDEYQIQESRKFDEYEKRDSRKFNDPPNQGRLLKDYSAFTATAGDNRIPSENECGVRSDTKDIIRRCDDLEKRVEQCSTKNIRDKIIQQLHEIDNELSKEEVTYFKEERRQPGSSSSAKHNQWHPEIHKKVRGELFKCLDQMSSMEKSCHTAQEEIARLRQYIKNSSEQKEFSEKTFKREALQLRMIVDEKSNEVEVLKANMDEAIKGLKNSEGLLQRVEELEKVVEEKDAEIERLKCNSSKDCEQLKETLAEKTEELEELRREMKEALESMAKLRVKTLKREEHLEKTRLEETIGTELSLLQCAITDVDLKMRAFQDENYTLKQELESKVSMLHEMSVENETLVNRLYTCEQESNLLKANLAAIKVEKNISSYFQQDQRIKQLEQALSEKGSVLNSSFRNLKSDQHPTGTEEHEQVIETLLDDNEKYLECIHEKDRLVEELKQQLERLQTSTDQRDVHEMLDTMEKNTASTRGKQQQEQKLQPSDVQERYLQIIQRKNKTIDELRANLEAVTAEADKKLINELLTALSNKNTTKEENGNEHERQHGIQEELRKIQKLLTSSHREMIDKVFTLEGILSSLQDENKTLRKQLGQSTGTDIPTPNEHLEEKFQRIMQENSTLRDSLNRPYPGLVQNILSQSEEVKRLHEENELLRLGLNENKRELVDSNLRKRQRIKDLQLQLEDLEQQLSNKTGGHKIRRRSSSFGHGRAEISPDIGGGQEQVTSEDFITEMKNQNKLLQRLEKDNQRLTEISRNQASDVRNQASEINALMEEISRLQDGENRKEILESEIRNLRNTLQDMDEEARVNQRRIRDLENELQGWKESTRTPDRTLDEGFTPISSPSRSRLSLGNSDREIIPKTLYADNKKLKEENEKAGDDIRRMTRIIEKGKASAERLEDKINDLEEQKQQLEKSVRTCEKNTRHANDALKQAERGLQDSQLAERQAKDDVAKLRKILQEVNKAHQEEDEVTGTVKMLTDNLNALQQERGLLDERLDEARQEKDEVTREFHALQSKIHGQQIDAANELEESEKKNNEIIELNNELDHLKNENGELQEINEQLVEQLEKIRSEANETQFKEWLEKDVENRLALLSPDTHRSDIGLDQDERQFKKDQQRIIRKLQIENQIMKAKLLSLEEENIAATKIVSDMERGHGHLTGTLRCHLILQRNTTAKLLEGSLQQYTIDFENLQRKFSTLEEKYDRRKKEKLKRRDDIWELFTNASATITNINAILNEGLVKIEEDLERELDANEFEDKDYKSRLWILRRRLSDVENRHRELQLRAEELNLRLDAKTTEYEVTQDELEDATRDLESRDSNLDKMKKELDLVTKERGKLNSLLKILKENENRTVGDVMHENEKLRRQFSPSLNQKPNTGNGGNQTGLLNNGNQNNVDLSDLIEKLNERDAALNVMRKMRGETEKENDELKRRINYLERKLKEVTDQRDKLQKEAQSRLGYMSFARDDFGTIHMLRDDLKRITNENAELKHDIVLKQRQMYDMSKDLHKLRIQLDLDSTQTEKKYGKKEDLLKNMIQDLAELKADKFLLETKLKDAERRIKEPTKIDHEEEEIDLERIFKQKLSEKEREIERLKRPSSRNSNPRRSPLPRDDTMSDVASAFDSSKSESKPQQMDHKKKIQDLKDENKILKEAIADKGLRGNVEYIRKIQAGEKKINQMRTEITHLNDDNDMKRSRIKELLTAIEDIKDGKTTNSKATKISNLIEKTKDDEMTSVLEKLHKSKQEVEEWKNKAENYEKDLDRMYISKQQMPDQANQQNDNLQNKGMSMILPKAPTTPSNQESLYAEISDIRETPPRSPQENPESSRKTPENNRRKSPVSRIPVSPLKRQKSLPKILPSREGSNQDKSRPSISQRKKWELPGEKETAETPPTTTVSGKTDSNRQDKVSELNLHIKRLTNELDIYRTNLDMNRHDTLDMLGHDRLNYKIDFQISMRCMDQVKTLQNDIYELEHENERLQDNYVNLAQTVDNFNNDLNIEVKEAKKSSLRRSESITHENTTLKSVVQSQKAEINELTTHLSNFQSQARKKEDEINILVEELQKKQFEQSSQKDQDLLTMKDDILQKNEELASKQENLLHKNKDLTRKIHEIESVKAILETKLANYENISEQLKQKSEDYTKLQRKLNSNSSIKKTSELKNVKEELEKQKEEFTKLSEQLKKKTEELHRKENGLGNKSNELKNVKTELVNKTVELQTITEQLANKIEDCKKLKKLLNARQKNRKEHVAKLKSTEDKSESETLEKETMSQVTPSMEMVTPTMEKSHTTIVATLNEEIDKRNDIIQNMRTHIDKLKEQEQQKRDKDHEIHEASEARYKNVIKQLEEKVSINEREADESLMEAIKALEDAKEKLVMESEMKRTLIERLEQTKKVLNEEKERNEKDQYDLITELQTVIDEFTQYKRNAQTELQTVIDEFTQHKQNAQTELQTVIDEFTQHKQNAQTELETVIDEFIQYKQNSQTKMEKTEALKDEYTLYKENVKFEIENLMKVKDDYTLYKKNAQSEIERLYDVNNDFARYQEKAQAEIDRLNSLLDQVKSDSISGQQQNDEELKAIKAEFTLYKETTHAEIEKLNAIKDEFTLYQEATKREFQESDKYKNEFTLYKEKAQNELENLEDKFNLYKVGTQKEIEKLNSIKDEFTLYKEKTKTDIDYLKAANGQFKREKESRKKHEFEQLNSIKAEYVAYKENADNQIENLIGEVKRLEKQTNEYKSLLDKGKLQRTKKQSRVDSTSNLSAITEEIILPVESSTAEAVPADPHEFYGGNDQPDGNDPNPEQQLFSPGNDLEIEMEILQGCNEDLEQEIESLKIEIKTLEYSKKELKDELNETKVDLKKTLEYLRDLNDKNELMAAEHDKIMQRLQMEKREVEMLQTKINAHEYQHEDATSKKEVKLEHQLRRLDLENKQHTATIEQLEELIDQLESENNRKETAFEKLKRNNETNIKELEAVASELEEEIKMHSDENDKMKTNRAELQMLIGEKDEQIRQLTERNEKLEYDKKKKTGKKSRSASNIDVKDLKLLTTISEESKEIRSEEEIREMDLKILELEASLAKWIRVASKQTGEVERLNTQLRTFEEEKSNTTETNEIIATSKKEAEVLMKQVITLKEEIEKKNRKLQSLRDEVHDKDQQYSKILASLNKRREESKTFLAMQQTLQDEIDKKEDLIRKLKFKIKSSDMDVSMGSLNVSRDNFDQSEIDFGLSDEEDGDVHDASTARRKSDVIGQNQEVIVNLTNQLFSLRSRNQHLANQLELCRIDYMSLKEQKEKLENTNTQLQEHWNDSKEKLAELRDIIQCSSDIQSDGSGSHHVGLKTKLYASYKELREKSIEIASLQMCMEIKDDEIETLTKEIERLVGDIQTRSQSAIDSQSRDVSESQSSCNICTHSDDIKILVQELNERERNENELQTQITKLREHLLTKDQQSDYLQAQLSKVTTRFRDIEQKLSQQDEDLRKKFLHAFEDDNSDISEITPLNSLKLYSAPIETETTETNQSRMHSEDPENKAGNQSLNDTFNIDDLENDGAESITTSQQDTYRIENPVEEKLKDENAYFKEQVANLQTEIYRINQTNEQKNESLQQQLTNKDDTIQQLQTALTTLHNDNNDAIRRQSQLKDNKNNMILKTKLELKEKRHVAELETLKLSLLNAKREHLASISQKLETNFEEKVFFKMKTTQLEQLLKIKNKEILNLKSKFIY